MDNQELSPEELIVAAEGQALEGKVKKLRGIEDNQSRILDSSGKPIEYPVIEEKAVSLESTEKENYKRAMEMARSKVKENADTLTKILDSNPEVKAGAVTVLTAYKLLFFALNDIGASSKEMTEELLMQLSDSMRAAAVHGGVDVYNLRHDILGKKVKDPLTNKMVELGVLPYLKDRIEYYAQNSRKRKAAINQVHKRIGNKGIALPCYSLTDLYNEKPFFTAGCMIVIHGEERAVRMALRHCAFRHQTVNGANPYYLSADREKQNWDAAFTVMHQKWWRNAAKSDHDLIETFQPIVDSSSVLLLMEGLTYLLDPDKPVDIGDDWQRKAKALSKLYQWAVENLVAAIVGDFVEGDVDERTYGKIPHIAVKIAKVNADEQESLFIGNDKLPLIFEE